MLPNAHPQRDQLMQEAHARPPLALPCPASLVRLSILYKDAGDKEAMDARLAQLCDEAGAPFPGHTVRYHQVELDGVRIAWERHTEFTTLTIVTPVVGEDPFEASIVDEMSGIWSAFPGQLLGATRIEIRGSAPLQFDEAFVARAFKTADFPVSFAGGGTALVATDFREDAEGFTRILMLDAGMSEARRGRMAQRLLEVDTYRIAALLALPLAQEANETLTRLETRSDELAYELTEPPDAAKDRLLLEELSKIAGDVQALDARDHYRFAASQAYDEIMRERLARLREERIEGRQRLGVFLEQRQAPAMRTCAAVQRRQQALADRVGRIGQLLATRVNVALEDQNARLLASMDQRARMQLRLQETVESFSAVAITYYGSGLINYISKGLAESIWPFLHPTWITAAAAPIIFAGTWFGIRRLRRRLRG